MTTTILLPSREHIAIFSSAYHRQQKQNENEKKKWICGNLQLIIFYLKTLLNVVETRFSPKPNPKHK